MEYVIKTKLYHPRSGSTVIWGAYLPRHLLWVIWGAQYFLKVKTKIQAETRIFLPAFHSPYTQHSY